MGSVFPFATALSKFSHRRVGARRPRLSGRMPGAPDAVELYAAERLKLDARRVRVLER
jgi:hypothetical protein